MKKMRLIVSAFSAVLLASCASPQLEVRPAVRVKPGEHAELPLYDWQGDGVPGPVSIRISLAEQKAYIQKGGKPVGWTYIASGRARFPTPRGSYRIMEKKADKHSNKYGMIVNRHGDIVDGDATAGRESVPSGGRFRGAPMPYWMRLTSYGIGMHAGPIPDPGFPASHGCIRLPPAMAATLFSEVKVGTLVVVQ